MARKKKRKKGSAPKQSAEPNDQAPAPPGPVASPEPPPPVVIADAPPAQSALPASPQPTAPPLAPDEPVEDLDADLDEEGAADYESLVAQVAGLPDDTPRRPIPGVGRTASPAAPAPADDVVEVLDLDDEDDATEAVDRLIAKAVVGAPREEAEPEPDVPLIDLDADEAAPPPRARAAAGAPSAGPPPSRLVAAAAAGGSADDSRGISLDLGEVSTPEARARLLAEALAHAEHKEARYRVPLADTRPARRWKALAATALFLVSGMVAVAPPAWVRPAPPAQLNAAARARGIRTALILQAQQVEAFRVRSQRLPTSLDELPTVLGGVRYTRSGNRAYQLVAYESDGNAIVYDSANPAPPFRILMAAWAAVGSTP